MERMGSAVGGYQNKESRGKTSFMCGGRAYQDLLLKIVQRMILYKE